MAMGEAGGSGEGAYADGDEAAKGEYGRFRCEALAGVCDWCVPCCGGARATVLSRGGCTARRRKGDICGAWTWTWNGSEKTGVEMTCGEVDEGGGGGGGAARGTKSSC